MMLIFLGIALLGFFAIIANIISGLAEIAKAILPPIIVIGGIILIILIICG